MANMSYCRFQNTLKDLEDCYDDDNMGEWNVGNLSDEEKEARLSLIRLCSTIAHEFGDEI